jgi:hypothetical protein
MRECEMIIIAPMINRTPPTRFLVDPDASRHIDFSLLRSFALIV